MASTSVFTPVVRGDVVVRQYGNEVVAWSSVAAEPVFLDPVAALILQIVDGRATVDDLVEDIHDVVGVETSVARQEVHRALGIYAAGGLLETSTPADASGAHAPFRAAPSEQVGGRARNEEMSPLDLRIGDRAVRLMCADDEVLEELRGGLAPFVTRKAADLGFVLHVPTGRQRLYVLTDRSGFVLGRTTERNRALTMLAGHLTAFLPARDGTFRLHARAMATLDGAALLAPWPLLLAPPVVEERLDRIGLRVIDRLWVDVDPAHRVLDCAELPWEGAFSFDPGPGHLHPADERLELTGILLPDPAGEREPTKAQLVHYVAALMVGVENRSGALAAADAVAAAVWSSSLVETSGDDLHDQLARVAADRWSSADERTGAPATHAGRVETARSIEASYDELPYGSKAFVDSHPVQLSTTAELGGLATMPVDRCRVLEIGCGEGGNLLPVAEAYPNSEFVGIDLSSRQIESGTVAIRQLGLRNVELHHLDVTELDDSFGRFDYIICHGVFSWVPGPVQSKILDICRANAQPGGVSYISYNTYPGWHLRSVLRRAMLRGTEQVSGLIDKVAVARHVLATLIQDIDPESSHGALIKGTAEAVLDDSDAYIAHEYLAPINEPLYHSEFVERASAHGLRWLGDQRMTANPALLGHPLISIDPGDASRQEYNDMVADVAFRGAVLCRSDAVVEPDGVPGRLQAFRVSTSLSAPKRLDLAEGVPATFTGRDIRDNALTLESDSTVFKTALKHLAGRSESMSFAELADVVASDLAERGVGAGRDVPAVLANDLAALRAFHANEAVEFLRVPYSFTRTLRPRPRVSAWARWEAERGMTVTTRKNHQLDVGEPIRRFLVQRLDGTRTIEQLVAEVASEVASGELVIERRDGTKVEAGGADEAMIRSVVESRLDLLARSAMLVD